MKAITVQPGHADSARLEEFPEPHPREGPILVQTIAVGVCGTDREIVQGAYGAAAPGEERLVLGHESLGRVLETPPGHGVQPGDLVVGVVRHPDPVPCELCAVGEWDMCRNGRYTERGIKGLDGFCRERFRLQPSHVVRVAPELGMCGVLVEPTSIVAKAWAQIDYFAERSRWTPRRVLVLGTGPIGLLGALCATQRGLEVHVLGRDTEGLKPQLARALGATYHTGSLSETCTNMDVVLECTGASQLLFDAMRCVAPTGIVCLTGISSGQRKLAIDAAALNNELVLENNIVFGTVNANRAHYREAAEVLALADGRWLNRLITRTLPLEHWRDAYEPAQGDIKSMVQSAAL